MNQGSTIEIAPGEVIRYSAQFSPNLLFTHLKTSVVITETRVIVRRPNTIFAIVPMGYIEHTSPIQHISQLSAGEALSSRRVTAGVIAMLLALYAFVVAVSTFPAVLLLAIVFGIVAAVLFLTARSLGVIFRNHGGGDLIATAGRNERARVDDARRTITALWFGDGTPAPAPVPAPFVPPVVTPSTGEFTRAQAVDPTTSHVVLARIVESQPELRPLVAANPNTYPDLLQWLGSLGDPAVDEALRTRV